MKGVIWKIAPEAQIADLSHEIAPQDILEGAILLWRSTPYYPDGTIHLAVVDPGVGTSRRGIAAQIGASFFVGPDNGLFSLVAEKAEADHQPVHFIYLDKPRFWLAEVSNVFHGRDIFAPVAAYLAKGIPLAELGTAIENPVRLELAKPKPLPTGWLGEVIHTDHFGNLSTNINISHINDPKNVVLKINHQRILGLVSTYGERPAGSLIALLDSSGSLAISVVNGSAAEVLKAQRGDKVEISFAD